MFSNPIILVLLRNNYVIILNKILFKLISAIEIFYHLTVPYDTNTNYRNRLNVISTCSIFIRMQQGNSTGIAISRPQPLMSHYGFRFFLFFQNFFVVWCRSICMCIITILKLLISLKARKRFWFNSGKGSLFYVALA